MLPALGEDRMLLWGEALAGNTGQVQFGAGHWQVLFVKHTLISKVTSFEVAPNRKPTLSARSTASLAGWSMLWGILLRLGSNP